MGTIFRLLILLGAFLSAGASAWAAKKSAKPKVYRLEGTASWYGPGFHGKRTASGERFDQNGLSAACNAMFRGKCRMARVTNKKNGKQVVVRINDTGGFEKLGRVIDLSKGAGQKLGIVRGNGGLGEVIVEALDAPVTKAVEPRTPARSTASLPRNTASLQGHEWSVNVVYSSTQKQLSGKLSRCREEQKAILTSFLKNKQQREQFIKAFSKKLTVNLRIVTDPLVSGVQGIPVHNPHREGSSFTLPIREYWFGMKPLTFDPKSLAEKSECQLVSEKQIATAVQKQLEFNRLTEQELENSAVQPESSHS